jgi:Co/Zn/Cd efflux system component
MDIYGRRDSARLYLAAAIVTFFVAAFQVASYYKGIAESISLFADTFHAWSDGVTLLGTVLLLLLRAKTNFAREERIHSGFTYFNIALLFGGVGLATHELWVHAGEAATPNWTVVLVAALGGFGDFLVWRMLVRVKIENIPASLRTNHAANVLHIMQDLWQSVVVVVAGVAIRFGIPYVDTALGAVITFLIFWEGLGLAYEEWTGRRFPYHFHLFGGHGHQHGNYPCKGHNHHH